MSFQINWPASDYNSVEQLKRQLTELLNREKLPDVITEKITVSDLRFGDRPPEVEILDVEELSMDPFNVKISFRLCYSGSFRLALRTAVQLNPLLPTGAAPPGHRFSRGRLCWGALADPRTRMHERFGMVSAQYGLALPIELAVTNIRVDGTLQLHLNMSDGLQASFVKDPLEHIEIQTSFDVYPGVKGLLQRKAIEALRDFLMRQMPEMVKQQSKQWLSTAKPAAAGDGDGGSATASTASTAAAVTSTSTSLPASPASATFSSSSSSSTSTTAAAAGPAAASSSASSSSSSSGSPSTSTALTGRR